MPVSGSRGIGLWVLMLKGKQQILGSHMQSIPITTFTCFLTSPCLSLPISFNLSKIHIPPTWPITCTRFYMGNHFCVSVPQAPWGTTTTASWVWLLCTLASLTPPTEDLQGLTQQDGSTGFSPPFHGCMVQQCKFSFLFTWCGKGTSTWISMCFDSKYTKV